MRKNITCVLLAIISSMALLVNNSSVSEALVLSEMELYPTFVLQLKVFQYYWQAPEVSSLVLILALFYLYKFILFKKNDNTIFSIVFSIISSVSMIIGLSYKTANNLQLLKFWLVVLILLVGYGTFFYANSQFILEFLDKNLTCSKESELDKNNKVIFWKNFLIIFLLWLPYLIIFSPGTLFPDGMDQLNKFFGYGVWTRHHPPLSTMLIGLAVSIGRLLGADNFGLFLYVFIQSIICAYTFAKVISMLNRFGISKKIQIIVLIFYSVFTVWPAYAQCMIKDTLFYAVSLLFFMKLIDIVIADKHSIKDYVLLSFTAILTCLLRNNGTYMVWASFPIIIFASRKRFKRGLISIIFILLICFSFNDVLVPHIGITKGGTQEALSIPFQQTARYVQTYCDEVTSEEREAIDGVLNYEQICAKYNPNVSDPVKGTYHWAYDAMTTMPGEKEALKEYFKVWIKMFFKHPLCYLEATINNTYAYFYPNETSLLANAGYYQITNDPVVDLGEFEFHYWLDITNARTWVENLSEFMRRIPGIGLLYSSGTYGIVLVYIVLHMIFRKRWIELGLILPYIMLMLTCIASPVNGALRYLLPMIAAMPLLIAIFIRTVKVEK